jgi:hypothetical protein
MAGHLVLQVGSSFLLHTPSRWWCPRWQVALVAHEGQATRRCADTMGNNLVSFLLPQDSSHARPHWDMILCYHIRLGEGHNRIRVSFGSCQHSAPASLASHPFPKCGLLRSDRDFFAPSRCLPTLSPSGVPIAPSRPPMNRSLLGGFS